MSIFLHNFFEHCAFAQIPIVRALEKILLNVAASYESTRIEVTLSFVHGVIFSNAQWFCTCSSQCLNLRSPCTSSTCLKENWASDGFESRMALELIGVGSINHAHAHSTYNLGPIKYKKRKRKRKKHIV